MGKREDEVAGIDDESDVLRLVKVERRDRGLIKFIRFG